ncbi:MAG TPA: glutathione S-transferase N-terminal domain-containing protein [Solirubrobacteraceae bacterium]|nr:glutathione S-transferase N-terminal domain-containing protein [Solirubrobacteraceae bacterium]
MKLYTCGQTDHGAALGHPCGRAARALREAGHTFEIEVVEGYRLMPWTRRGKRDAIRELSGQEDVPVLVADDGEVVSGTGTIVRWAKDHPAG